MTGLNGEMHFKSEKANFLVAFSNPLVGCCKGHTMARAAHSEFDKSSFEGDSKLDVTLNDSQKEALFETKFKHDRFPPIYTVVLMNF